MSASRVAPPEFYESDNESPAPEVVEKTETISKTEDERSESVQTMLEMIEDFLYKYVSIELHAEAGEKLKDFIPAVLGVMTVRCMGLQLVPINKNSSEPFSIGVRDPEPTKSAKKASNNENIGTCSTFIEKTQKNCQYPVKDKNCEIDGELFCTRCYKKKTGVTKPKKETPKCEMFDEHGVQKCKAPGKFEHDGHTYCGRHIKAEKKKSESTFENSDEIEESIENEMKLNILSKKSENKKAKKNAKKAKKVVKKKAKMVEIPINHQYEGSNNEESSCDENDEEIGFGAAYTFGNNLQIKSDSESDEEEAQNEMNGFNHF